MNDYKFFLNDLIDAILENDENSINYNEDKLAKFYENLIKDDDFYQIPIDNFLSIIGKINFTNDNFIENIKIIIQKITSFNPEISGVLLNNINCKDLKIKFQLQDCIDILGSFSSCELCMKISEFLREESQLVSPDYTEKINQLEKQLEKAKGPKNEESEIFNYDLVRAAHSRTLTDFKKLIEKNSQDCKMRNKYKETPFIAACSAGKLDIVEYLVKNQNVDMHARNIFGWEGIHVACREGHLDVVRFLNDNGIECNQEDSDKSLPIHHACEKGHIDIVKYLIDEKGVSPEITGELNSTPLHEASKYGQLSIVKYLIENKNVNPMPYDEDKWTPLMWACRNGHVDIVKFFIETCHLSINETDQFNDSYLHIASAHGQTAVVKYLLENGANKLQRNKFFEKPHEIACSLATSNDQMNEIRNFLINSNKY